MSLHVLGGWQCFRSGYRAIPVDPRDAYLSGLGGRKKLYVWQPDGHGQFSWFVMAGSLPEAIDCVEREMDRRKSLPFIDIDHISDYECEGWRTNYYKLTVLDSGFVAVNPND